MFLNYNKKIINASIEKKQIFIKVGSCEHTAKYTWTMDYNTIKTFKQVQHIIHFKTITDIKLLASK